MSMEGESLVNRGKDNLLIPAHSEVCDCFLIIISQLINAWGTDCEYVYV